MDKKLTYAWRVIGDVDVFIEVLSGVLNYLWWLIIFMMDVDTNHAWLNSWSIDTRCSCRQSQGCVNPFAQVQTTAVIKHILTPVPIWDVNCTKELCDGQHPEQIEDDWWKRGKCWQILWTLSPPPSSEDKNWRGKHPEREWVRSVEPSCPAVLKPLL